MFDPRDLTHNNYTDEKNADNANFEIQLFTRKSQKKGFVAIYCHIAINKKRTRQPFSTGIKLPAKDWDKKKDIISGEGYEIEKSELNRMSQNIYYIFLELVNSGETFDAETIKHRYKTPIPLTPKLDTSVKKILELHCERYTKNKRYAASTLRKVRNFIKRTNAFFKEKDATELQDTDLDNYYVWLTSKHNNSHNVAVRAIEFLKAALDTGQKKGYLPFVPCCDYEIKRKYMGKKMYLNKKELALLENCHFFNKNLARIRDVFIFCCYTGLDFGDSKAFRADWVKQDEKGIEYIDYKRAKTDFKGQVRFFKKAKDIAEKYNYVLPIGANQYHNKMLKQACYLSGIPEEKAKRISTHSARVTAGMVWLNSGMSLETVQRMLAHSHKSTTERYYAEKELETMLEESQKLEGF